MKKKQQVKPTKYSFSPFLQTFEEKDFEWPVTVIGLQTLAALGWAEYWSPKKPLSKEEKRLIREKYNEVVTKVNKANPGTFLLLTESTKIAGTPKPLRVAEPVQKPKNSYTSIAPVVNMPVSKTNRASQDSKSAPVKGQAAKNQPVKQTTKATDKELPKGGKVAEIIALYRKGKTKAEIIEAGYNKNTVNRQIGEYIKKQKNGK